jgi:hypothetical protein
MSFSTDLVKNYKERQKSIKELKEKFKEELKMIFLPHKEAIINAYISGESNYSIIIEENFKNRLEELYVKLPDYKISIFREIFQEQEIAVIVDWFDTYIRDEESVYRINIWFSDDSKIEQDKKINKI